MPEANLPDFEVLLRAEVDRAVAPYEKSAPPFVLAKMRALAERYYRENPDAARALRLLGDAQRVKSGVEPVPQEGDAGDEAPPNERRTASARRG
jgi:hypothetical protein